MGIRLKLIRVGLLLVFLLCFTPSVFAVSLSFSNIPASIDRNQEVEVSFVLACDGCDDSYFRGVFYKSGSNYFGLTKNNSGNWIATVSDKTQYYKLSKDELKASSGSGKLLIKPDIEDTLYDGLGSYMFKVIRYTGGGSSTFADPVAVTITGPSPTPTSSPTPTNTPTNSPQPTGTHAPSPTTKATSTPTPKKTLTPKPTEKTSITPTEKSLETVTQSSQTQSEGDILGANDENTTTPSGTSGEGSSNKVYIITLLCIGIGFALISLAFVFRKQFFQDEGV